MLKVQNLLEKQKEGNPNINMVIYGNPGTGKTRFAASSSAVGRTLFLDVEAGSGFIPEEYAREIDIMTVKDTSELGEILKPENIRAYKTIVIDSITEVMKKMVDRAKGAKERPTLADWGKVISDIETYVRNLRDLEKNVILVALAQEKDDDGSVLLRPSLSGKNLPAAIVGFVDICLYFSRNSDKKIVAFSQSSEKFYAKDRSDKLPATLMQDDTLNFKHVMDLVAKPVEMATEEQKNAIDEKMKRLEMKKEDMEKAKKYVGLADFEKMNVVQFNKLNSVLDKKISKAFPVGGSEKENAPEDPVVPEENIPSGPEEASEKQKKAIEEKMKKASEKKPVKKKGGKK